MSSNCELKDNKGSFGHDQNVKRNRLQELTNDSNYYTVLNGTINLKAFISPIKSTNSKKKDYYNSQAGILCSTPNCQITNNIVKTERFYSSTPTSSNYCFRKQMNKINEIDTIKKRKNQFLDNINEDLTECTASVSNAQMHVKVLSVSKLNDLSESTMSSCQSEPEQQPKVDFGIKKESVEPSSQPESLTKTYELHLPQIIDKKMNIEKFMSPFNRFDKDFLHRKSLPARQPIKVIKRASLSASKIEKQRRKKTKNETEELCLRRSKRAKIDKTEVGIYEFETVKDFKGNDLIVWKLVGKKSSLSKKTEFSKSCQKSPETMPRSQVTNKEPYLKQEEKKEVYELIEPGSGDRVDVNLFSYTCYLEKKQFRPVSDGVTMYMADEDEGDDGVLCLEPGSYCKTQRHTCPVFYVVRKGRCSFRFGDSVTYHDVGDVVKIPSNIKYKIGNDVEGEISKAYVHFQFL